MNKIDNPSIIFHKPFEPNPNLTAKFVKPPAKTPEKPSTPSVTDSVDISTREDTGGNSSPSMTSLMGGLNDWAGTPGVPEKKPAGTDKVTKPSTPSKGGNTGASSKGPGPEKPSSKSSAGKSNGGNKSK